VLYKGSLPSEEFYLYKKPIRKIDKRNLSVVAKDRKRYIYELIAKLKGIIHEYS